MNNSVGHTTTRGLISHGPYSVRKIANRGAIVGLLALASTCLCSYARADIIYNVDVTDMTETVTGTITTDGNTGALLQTDITAWNLVVTGPDAFSISSADSGSTFSCDASGCGVSATLAHLSPAAGDGSFYEPVGSGYDEVIFSENNWGEVECPTAKCLVAARLYTSAFIASVPEPSSLAVLGVGLIVLGFARKRFRVFIR